MWKLYAGIGCMAIGLLMVLAMNGNNLLVIWGQ